MFACDACDACMLVVRVAHLCASALLIGMMISGVQRLGRQTSEKTTDVAYGL